MIESGVVAPPIGATYDLDGLRPGARRTWTERTDARQDASCTCRLRGSERRPARRLARVSMLDDAREGMDPDIRPQDDLFGHVNGRWLDDHGDPRRQGQLGAFVRARRRGRGAGPRDHRGAGRAGRRRRAGLDDDAMQDRLPLRLVHGRASRRGARRRADPAAARRGRQPARRARPRGVPRRVRAGRRQRPLRRLRRRRRPRTPTATWSTSSRAASACPTSPTTATRSSPRSARSTSPT